MSFDINKIVIWNKFKERTLTTLDESKPFEVDLAFEYKDNGGHIISYSSGEHLFIRDIKFSLKPELCFEIPNGAESRFIPLPFADSVSSEELGPLDEWIEKVYLEVLDEYPDIKEQLPATLKLLVGSITSEEVNSFNNSADWIKQTIDAERDRKSFETIDKFGMF